MSIAKLIHFTGKPVLCDFEEDLFWVEVDGVSCTSVWSFDDAALRTYAAIKKEQDEAHEDYKRHIEHEGELGADKPERWGF